MSVKHISVPDWMAEKAKDQGLSLSRVTQDALRVQFLMFKEGEEQRTRNKLSNEISVIDEKLEFLGVEMKFFEKEKEKRIELSKLSDVKTE